MTEPRPLHEEFPATAVLLERLPPSEALAPGHERRLWSAVLERRAQRNAPALPRYSLPAFVAAAAVASLLVVVMWPASEPAVTEIPGAQLAARSGQPSLLTAGAVRGAPSRTLARLATPHANIEWTQARFLLDVTGDGSVLLVEQGEVVWRPNDGKAQRVTAGQRVRAPRPKPVELPRGFGEVTVAPSAQCAGDRACLEGLAQGENLAAQNALFELGRYEEYLQRFPDGVLAPEAGLAQLSALVRAERYPEALALARSLEARFGNAEVRALRIQLERHEAFSR